MNKRIYNIIFMFIMAISIMLPDYVLAEPSKTFTNVMELRSNSVANSPLTGYAGALRETAGLVSEYGYYLGTTNQYLPYKVGNVQRGALDYKGETVTIDSNSFALFCTEFGNLSPADNSYINITEGNYSEIANGTPGITCTQTSDWSIGIQAGVGAIIKNITNGQPVFSSATLSKYYDGEIAINQFLYEKLGNSINHQNSDGSNVITNYDRNLIEIANKAFEKATNEFSVTWPSNKLLAYSNDEKIWKSEYISVANIQYLDNYNVDDYSNLYDVVLKDSTGKVYEKYAYLTTVNDGKIQIGVCDNNTTNYCKEISNYTELPAGTYTLSVTIGEQNGKTYPIAKNYACSGKQDVTPAYTWTGRENTIDSATFSFTIEEEIIEDKTGSVTVKKIDSKTKEFVSGAVMHIIDATGEEIYRWTTTTKSLEVLLPYGEYILEEVNAPEGYSISNTRIQFEINDEYSNIELEFVNDEIVNVPNTLSKLSIALIVLGIIGLTSGSWLIYSSYRKEKQV